MGTKFRTMLAPIGASTGDGRRFQSGAITLADLPMPFEWARSREGGHDGAVSIGAVQEAAILSVKDALAGDWISADAVKGMDPKAEAVWGRGELFDDIDREAMPRLAEDVAEAMHLIGANTLGPSVDLDTFDGVPVMEGSDEPVTYDEMEAYWAEHGADPKLELLVTEARVRAATLVSIPAFAETTRPLELLAPDPEAVTASQDQVLALIASVGTVARPETADFALPALTGPTPITWDWEAGRVFGHIATWKTCHVGYEGVCVTPPREDASYAWFNRFAVDTAEGEPVWAGRITVGGHHAGLALNASATMAEYDGKTVAAHVRAYADDYGIVVAGPIEPGLSEDTRTVLERRKVSGDWREVSGGLSLVEVLALSPGPRAHSEPGFPVNTFSLAGRQVALVASFSPDPDTTPPGRAPSTTVDVDALAAALERRQEARAERQGALAALSATVDSDQEARRTVARTALAAAIEEG